MSPNKGTIIAKTWFLAKKYTLLHIDNQLFFRKNLNNEIIIWYANNNTDIIKIRKA